MIRLGLHVNNHGHEADILRYVREVRPPFMKFLADALNPGLMNECRALGTKVILRPVADSIEPGAGGWRVLRDQVLAVGREHAGCFDYLEGANEELQGKDDPGEIDSLAELLIDFMEACEDAGFRAANGGFSVGQPEVERWSRPAIAAMLDRAGRGGHLITLHEYYHSRPWDLLDGGRDAWARNGQAEGWLMLRCVKAVKVWRSLGIHVPHFVVSEAGRDDVTAAPGFGKGWRDEPTTPDGDYADFMAQYCRHLSAIPECDGAVDFGYATIQPEKWGSFDLAATAMFDRMIEEQRKLQGGTMTDIQKLAAEAQAAQRIQFNPGAALQRAAVVRGWTGPSPNSGEWTSQAGAFAGQQAQRFEWPNGRVEVATWNPATGRVTWTDITAIVAPK